MAYDYISRGKAKENGYTNTRVFKMFGVSSTGYYNYVSRREWYYVKKKYQSN